MWFSAFDTPAYTGEKVLEDLLPLLVSPGWVEERKVRWGVTRPIYQSKVLGEFPDISDDTLILPKWIQAAQKRTLERTRRPIIAADIARFGEDETVIMRREAGWIRVYRAHHKADTMTTAGYIAKPCGTSMTRTARTTGSGDHRRSRRWRLSGRPPDSSTSSMPHCWVVATLRELTAQAEEAIRAHVRSGASEDTDDAVSQAADLLGALRLWADSQQRTDDDVRALGWFRERNNAEEHCQRAGVRRRWWCIGSPADDSKALLTDLQTAWARHLTSRRRAFNRAERAGSPTDAAMINVASHAGESITGNLMTKAWWLDQSDATLLRREHLRW
jgi:hypothetical protein